MFTRFEQLPNELILHVFNYFDIRNLYTSFWGINSRLNNVLRLLNNLAFIYDANDPFLYFDIFASQINRLKINTSQSIDFSQFSNLKFLELLRANDFQLDQIRSDLMPKLTNLSISTSTHITLPYRLIRDIFSNEFPLLEHANLNRLDTFPNSFYSQSFSLRSLQITCTNPNIISQILLTCPNLSKFNITFFGYNQHILPPKSASYDHILEEFSLYDPHHRLTVETIQVLFLYIPNVKILYLNFLCRIPFINFLDNLLNHLKSLDRFECEIFESPNNEMIDIETIQQMHECFQSLQCVEKENNTRLYITE